MMKVALPALDPGSTRFALGGLLVLPWCFRSRRATTSEPA